MNEDTSRFQAVDIHTLRATLGAQCSPDPRRAGYVVGPDVNGRLSHVASCFNLDDARAYAAELNGKSE